MKLKFFSQQGYSALVSMLLIVAISLTIALGINAGGIYEIRDSLTYSLSNESFYFADSCVEEAIIRLKRDENYTGGSLTSGDIQCTVGVTLTATDTYTINSLANLNNLYYREIEAIVTVEVDGQARNISLTSWSEI